MDKSKYLYRRQYILGPRYIEEFYDWKKIKIDDNLYLTYHSDLEVIQKKYNNKEITILGYAIDYRNTSYSNEDIVNDLINKSSNMNEFIENTYPLSGRWILIYKDEKNKIVINDPGAIRQIFYTNENNNIWIASQPQLIANNLSLNSQVNKDNELRKLVLSK